MNGVPDLVVNTENLRNLERDLGTIHRTLSNAETHAQELVGMIPHTKLASTVESFTNDWDRRRTDLTDQVEALRQRTGGVADAFEGTDAQLAEAVQENPS